MDRGQRQMWKRDSIKTWEEIGRRLLACMTKIETQASTWTNQDVQRDFTSDTWLSLEQGGDTFYQEAVVSLAEDLTSPDQMRGARAALQEFANDSPDHLALFIQTTEQIKSHKLAMETWKTENEQRVWYTLKNYVGLL